MKSALELKGLKEAKDLPPQVTRLVDLFQGYTNCLIAAVGVGPGRGEIVKLKL